MLKKMTITIKKEIYATYEISEENGFDMPIGTKETVSFVDSVKENAKEGAYEPVGNIDESVEILSVDYEDEE